MIGKLDRVPPPILDPKGGRLRVPGTDCSSCRDGVLATLGKEGGSMTRDEWAWQGVYRWANILGNHLHLVRGR